MQLVLLLLQLLFSDKFRFVFSPSGSSYQLNITIKTCYSCTT
ncbi:hypothetical protein CU011_1474 [Enterococcus faecium]|uniref:Uncharacterized protein n=1 Tax=Enterococcus faecium SD2A-2 TaxID=1244154 RepID=A0AB73ABG9_ENTFC|nr:hypothetical protein HMPREF0352_0593 [Enterococcus faecium TX1330]EFF31047.1 hypothetical protein EfmE1039_2389 [Enterococcus faecium E1039]EFF36579.1 hypothetical protein EfmE980_2444 [Enterococcus faecium E980]EJV53890.1 hypothetical protein HMPREF1345_01285 [Enterococcus faecium TX1337RF]EPI14473.1 hypothetical protein D356_00736 [Enterococcus faecium SD2A-2]KXA10127.1 hypothetical protein HMPREF3199_00946 [Enterococcus faecium]MBL4989983.1 hypothetical protein [Enterococcus lactis]